MQTKYIFLPPPGHSSPLRKVAAFIMTAVVLGLVLMFSAVLLVVIAIAGTIAGAYLWWKTRELRKQMRNFQPREAMQDSPRDGVHETRANSEEVFEGEVIRVVESESRHD